MIVFSEDIIGISIMGTLLELSIEGDKQISAELGIAVDGLKDFSEPMREAGNIMMDAVDDNFSKRGGRFGGWVQRKDNLPHPLLEKTGAMRKGFYKETTDNYAMVSNEDRKFPYHQSNQPRTKIPRRVMLMIDARMRDEIFKAFQAYCIKILRGQKGGLR
jgi:phage gpG-like protein